MADITKQPIKCNTIEDVRQVLKDISYKDNVQIHVEHFKLKNEWRLKLRVVEKCNYTDSNITLIVELNNRHPLPCKSSAVIKVAMELILWWECHEAFEKFKYHGEMVLDPHEKRYATPMRESVFNSMTAAPVFDSVKYLIGNS